MRVTVVSLESWNDVWRRNQHLVKQLLANGAVSRVTFIEPAVRGVNPGEARRPVSGVSVVTPRLGMPKRVGGLRLAARGVRALLDDCDVLWVNDPSLGIHLLREGRPTVYDVTDDWRSFNFPPRIRRRLVRAEDKLARTARTVVCSDELARLWGERYGIAPRVVKNGIDPAAWAQAAPIALEGPGPHIGYIGTLHEERLDVDLALRTLVTPGVGTFHMVGPDALSDGTRRKLLQAGVVLHGPAAAGDVPSWMLSMDVLVCPHRVTPFTMSLDAIKSYEYLTSGRRIVATPSSGFQSLSADTLIVSSAGNFPDAVSRSIGLPALPVCVRPDHSWTRRAEDFGDELSESIRAARSVIAQVRNR